MQNYEWYNSLVRPENSPPKWIFAPVWTILYGMIFLSLIVFLKDNHFKPTLLPLLFFGIQIVLNLSWSPVFFGLKNIKAAFYIVCFLVIFIILNIYAFYKTSPFAAILLVPYFLWTSYATYLNYQFLKLNT
ncbi:MAG: tryptophan-rich sensory protein [Clostridiaceae bacterium]|jgi:translocator protein|nr:tryptophan-rich sensory protein [Clostridiaceae bacterium]